MKKLLLIFALLILFGSAVRFSYGQNSAEFLKYKNFVSGLPPSDFNNVRKIINYYEKYISTLSQEERDLGFRIFRKFYDKVDSIFCNVLGTGDPNYTPENKIYIRSADPKFENEKDVIEFKSSLSECGFNLGFGSEPGYFVFEVPGFMVGKFSNYVSPVIGEYLRLREIDLQKPAYYDVYVFIDVYEMAERLIGWNKYMVDYPNSPYLVNVKNDMTRYLYNFLGIGVFEPFGEENGLIFDRDGNMLKVGKSLYEKIISECGDTYLGNLISEYYSVLKITRFKKTPETNEFLKQKGFEIFEENY